MVDKTVKMLFALNLQDYMDYKGVDRHQLAKATRLSYSAVSEWLCGRKFPRPETLRKIAEYLGIEIADLVDVDRPVSNLAPIPTVRRARLLGEIACGGPIVAETQEDEYVDFPEHIRADFALRCVGDSMINARIFDGDIVYIREQQTVENGEIAAVIIDDEATLKRVQIYPDRVALCPANPMYAPTVYSKEELSHIRIIGKAVAFTSHIR